MTPANWIAIAAIVASFIVGPFLTTWAQLFVKEHWQRKTRVKSGKRPPTRQNRNARVWRHLKENWLIFVVAWLGLWISSNILLMGAMDNHALPILRSVMKYGAIGLAVALIALLWQTRLRISD